MTRWRHNRRLLVAAATLVVGSAGLAAWLQHNRGGRDKALLRLVQAVGPRRFVQGRLSGGFRYGPLVTAKRSADHTDGQEWRLLAASAELKARADQSPSAENLQALAAAYLVHAEFSRAVEILEGLVDRGVSSAAIRSDLAAAYLARAEREGRSDDRPRALEAALIALEIDGAHREALFNKCLALEGLHLREQAIAAWEAYLVAYPRDDWEPAVREHLNHLHARSGRRGAAASLEQMRRRIEEELLSEWARSVRASNEPRTQQLLAELQTLADAYRARTADNLLVEVVASLSAPLAPGLLEGHEAYAAGLEAAQTDSWAAAQASFEAAERRLRAGGSPFHHWAGVQRAICAYYQGRHTLSLKLIESALQGARPEYRALRARAFWIRGLVRYVTGRPYDGWLAHRESLTHFEAIGEGEHAAFVHSLLGNDLAALGRQSDAWKEWLLALSIVPQVHDARRLHLLLWSMSRDTQRDHPRVALCLARELVLRIRGLPGPADAAALASALTHLARLAEGTPSQRETLPSLAEAERLLEGVPPDLRRTLEADVAAVRGRTLAGQDPEEAIEALTQAMGFYSEVDERFDRIGLLTLRARLLEQSGQPDRALRDAEDGLNQLRLEAIRLPTGSSRLRLATQVDGLATQLIYTLVGSGQTDRALLSLEWLRALAHGGRDAEAAVRGLSSLQVASQRLPAGVLVVEFVFLDRHLACWAIARDFQRFALLSDAAAEVPRLVSSVRNEVENGTWPAVSSAEIYRRLFGWLGDALEHYESLIVVPDGDLYGLPIGMIVDPRAERLGRRRAVSLAPSLYHVLRGTMPQGPPRSLLGVLGASGEAAGALGLVALPRAAAEVRSVAALYPEGRAATDLRADGFLRAAERAEVVHFAGHAVGSALRSATDALVMAGEGGRPSLVHAHDVETIRLRPGAIVVLAACQTGMRVSESRVTAPGLVQAFLDAGASAVVASLWDLDDRASEAVMSRLHRELAGGASAEQALQALVAQAEPRGRTDVGGLVVYVADRAVVPRTVARHGRGI